MNRKITDADVQIMAGIAATLESDYSDAAREEAWADSPFHWIPRQAPARIAKIGKELVRRWCVAKGLTVTAARGRGADLVIEGHRVRLKRATLWATDQYTFQQIRDEDYEYLMCLGLSPFVAHCWVIPKDVAMTRAAPQHGGRRGRDTRWIRPFPATDPPEWLRTYGGTLAEAGVVLQRLTRG